MTEWFDVLNVITTDKGYNLSKKILEPIDDFSYEI